MPLGFTPVNPLLTKAGALVTLVPVLGSEEAAMPTGRDQPHALSSIQYHRRCAVAVGGGHARRRNDLQRGIQRQRAAFYFDAMAFSDQYEEHQSAGKPVAATRWGIGIRILLRVTPTSGDAEFTFGLVSAAVQLGR